MKVRHAADVEPLVEVLVAGHHGFRVK